MGKPAILKVDIISDFVDKGIGDAQTGLGKLNDAAMAASTAIVGGLVVAGAKFAQMAVEDAASADHMATALRNTAGATDAQIASTEDWISAQGRALGVADDQLRPAMESLTRATGDVAKAQDLAALAMDVSVAAGVPVETAADAIAKAYEGQTTALGRLLPGMDQAALSSGDFATVQGELAAITGGAATANAATAAGQYEILQLQLSEAAEAIGAALLPIIETLLPKLQSMADWVGNNTETVTLLAGILGAAAAAFIAINTVVKVYTTIMKLSRAATVAYNAIMIVVRVGLVLFTALQWALNAAMAANPIMLVVIAIAALIAIFILAYKKCEPFKKIVDQLWQLLKNSVVGAFDAVSGAISTVVDWFKKAWDWVKKLIDKFTSFKVPSWVPGIGSDMAMTFTAAAAPAGPGQHAAAAPVVNVTVNGALDPEGVARQIRRILNDHANRNGLVGALQW